MQFFYNCQPNFKAGVITKEALGLMSKRMPSGEFVSLQERFYKTYDSSPMKIRIDATDKNSKRLDAMIMFNTNKTNSDKDAFFEYIEEGMLSSILCSPARFFNKIQNIYNKKALPFIKNGFKVVD